jgi:hypothetical protein
VVSRWNPILVLLAGCESIFPLEPPPLACPMTYSASQDGIGVYRVETTTFNFDDAQRMCVEDAIDQRARTHLVVLSSAEELETVRRVAGLDVDFQQAWVGFSDRFSEGAFQWITTEDVDNSFAKEGKTAPWASGEPNNGSGAEEDCAVLRLTEDLNDIECSSGQPFVCECDEFEVTPGF